MKLHLELFHCSQDTVHRLVCRIDWRDPEHREQTIVVWLEREKKRMISAYRLHGTNMSQGPIQDWLFDH
jgi:hypothetical protein